MHRDSRDQLTKFLKVTHMVVHEVGEFSNRSCDDLNVANTYIRHQIKMSQSDMRHYEKVYYILVASMCNVIIDQDTLPKIVKPNSSSMR